MVNDARGTRSSYINSHEAGGELSTRDCYLCVIDKSYLSYRSCSMVLLYLLLQVKR